jgi:hypothetical protein
MKKGTKIRIGKKKLVPPEWKAAPIPMPAKIELKTNLSDLKAFTRKSMIKGSQT